MCVYSHDPTDMVPLYSRYCSSGWYFLRRNATTTTTTSQCVALALDDIAVFVRAGACALLPPHLWSLPLEIDWRTSGSSIYTYFAYLLQSN